MNVKRYLHEVQAMAVDEASAQLYETMIGAMNAQIREAAAARLSFDDEPAHYARLLRDERIHNG